MTYFFVDLYKNKLTPLNYRSILYIMTYVVYFGLQTLLGQSYSRMDSIIKQWELNGIPPAHEKDYREYILNRQKKQQHHHSADTPNNSIYKTTTEDLCFNPGFELSDFSNWLRSNGTANVQGVIIPAVNYNNSSSNNYSYNTSVFAPETFVINSVIPTDSISGNGYDHYSFDGSNYKLKPLITGGGNYSARIGNGNPNYKANKIEYTFKVSVNQPYLIYNYTLVLSDGTHLDGEQAAFSVKLTDSVGNTVLLNNLPYMVNANDAINNPEFIKSEFDSDGYDVYYKKWHTDTINLCEYIGRTFKLVYEAIDCIYGAHFCYAYVDARCSDINVPPGQTVSCRDSLNTCFLAPTGYTNYQWTDSHGNLLSLAQGGDQSFLSFDRYMQYCATGNCSVNENDVFTLNIVTNSGCILTTHYTIKNYSISVSAASLVNSCIGGNSGSISLSPSGGLNNSAYNFSWYANNCTGSIISSSNPITNIPSGTYCVHITNGKCIPKDTVIYLSAMPTQVKEHDENLPGCLDSTYTIHATGNGLAYTWYQNNILLANQQTDSLKIDPLDLNSSYALTYTDAQGCKDSTRFHVSFTDTSNFRAVYCPNDSLALFISPSSYNPEKYQWYLNEASLPYSTISQNDSLIMHPGHINQLYVSYFENGCKKVATNFIKVFPEQIFLPDRTTNVFTPNNDGINDMFYPYEHSSLYSSTAIDLETNEYELNIYNRWGTLMYRSTQYSNGWNGKAMSGLPVSDDTYFWIASYLSNCSSKNEKTIKKGFVQLFR